MFDCPHKKSDNCGPYEGAGVVCSNIMANNTIELRGGSSRMEGNVFLYNRPVCDDSWGMPDANVACKMLG